MELVWGIAGSGASRLIQSMDKAVHFKLIQTRQLYFIFENCRMHVLLN